MNFPPDDVLIARGKYSTLSKARREQVKELQSACTRIMNSCHKVMTSIQADQPDATPIADMEGEIQVMKEAGAKVVELQAELMNIKGLAWD